MPFEPQEAKPIRKLSISYLLAIVAIVVVAIVGHYQVQRHLDRHFEAAQAALRSQELQALATRLERDASQVHAASELNKPKRLRELRATTEDWLQRHYTLTANAAEGASVSGLILPGSLMQHAINLMTRADDEDSEARALRSLYEASPEYHAALVSAASQAEAESAYALASIHRVDLARVILILVILAVQVAAVFQPALLQLRRHLSKLRQASDAIAEHQRLLQEQNELLSAEHEKLHGAAEILEATNSRLEAAARRFEELFQGLPIACLGFDAQGIVFEWNHACERLFGDNAVALFQQQLDKVLGEEHRDFLLDMRQRVFSGESVEGVEMSFGSNGRTLLCSMFPIHGPDGTVRGGIFACVDISEQKRYERQIEAQLVRINEYSAELSERQKELELANERLSDLALRDSLTGLHNHRAFQEALAREMKRAEREDTRLSLVMIDVDRFKEYNDRFGHPAGDAVLQKVAEVLTECARASDVVARYGGEEFVAILPNTGHEGALHVAERMRQCIEEAAWTNRPITISLGLATGSPALADGASLLKAADQALYLSKESGRNRVTSFGPAEDAAAA
jgi:diguanylate cyclase (GGDEF)-like protein/PAS domain S-box-containing protein